VSVDETSSQLHGYLAMLPQEVALQALVVADDSRFLREGTQPASGPSTASSTPRASWSEPAIQYARCQALPWPWRPRRIGELTKHCNHESFRQRSAEFVKRNIKALSMGRCSARRNPGSLSERTYGAPAELQNVPFAPWKALPVDHPPGNTKSFIDLDDQQSAEVTIQPNNDLFMRVERRDCLDLHEIVTQPPI
jgi:hypothetical protein